MTTTYDQIVRLAPAPEPFEPGWSRDTLAALLAESPAPETERRPWWRKTRRRAAALIAGGAIALTAGTAVAVGGPADVVKNALLDFSRQPNTTGNGLGVLHDPQLVAKFRTRNGVFAFWVATSSKGRICFASSNSPGDGTELPDKKHFAYGCGGELVDPTAPGGTAELTRVEQLGGFFRDSDGPIVYGISPYAAAVRAHVHGPGVDRTLPIRSDSHGYGAAIPEASRARAVTITFLDRVGHVLGSKRWIAPVG
jgi:hypothetical protein